MVASNTGPQLTWTNVVATIAVIAVLSGGGYKIIEAQFEYVRQSASAMDANLFKEIELNRRSLELIHSDYLTLREHIAYQHEQEVINATFTSRFVALENVQRDLVAHGAHAPIEAREVDQLATAIDKRFDAAQQQINDINRQIAASILPGYSPHVMTLPPHP
jgi:hypothetical protein